MIRFLFTILLGILFCPMLYGQHYIYPVATGSTWAREKFDKQEKRDWEEAMKVNLPEDAPDILRIFEEFAANYRLYNHYNDSIFIEQNNPEWIAMFIRRAHVFSNIYAQNNDNIEKLLGWFRQGEAPAEAYHHLYLGIRNLYHNNIIDFSLAGQMLEILIPYYESKNDYEHLMLCYSLEGFYKQETARMGLLQDYNESVEYYRKAIELGERYFSSFKDINNCYYFCASFINLSVLHAEAGRISLDESRKLRSRFFEFCKRPENKAVIDNDNRLREFCDWTMAISNLRGIMTYISHDMDDLAMFGQLYADYQEQLKIFNGDLFNLKNTYYGKVEYDDLIIDATAGRITGDEAYERFIEYYHNDPEYSSDHKISSYRHIYVYNLFTSFLFLVERTGKPFEEKSKIIKESLNRLLIAISSFQNIHFAIERGWFLSSLITNPTLLKYLSEQDKRRLFEHILVVGQPVTYVHVTMVSDLSRILTKKLAESMPEYFVGLPKFDSVEDVIQHKDTLLNFVTQSALYHDVGKIHIPTIVNNCFRRLSTEEYQLIKQHPEAANPFFDTYTFLEPYRDVALGHHKWYNGSSYPDDFDNHKSPIFPLINIVMLCDCMDAATENIGRNYHTPKSFETLISEFEEGAGFHYDPVLINFIKQNPDLYRQLKQKVLLGRMDHYFQLFSTIRQIAKLNSL